MAKKQFLPEGNFEITNGPSKFELMNSVFAGLKVKITCNIGTTPQFQPVLQVYFSLIGATDGGYDSWKGQIRFVDDNYETPEHRTFYYNSKNRTGTIHDRRNSWVSIFNGR